MKNPFGHNNIASRISLVDGSFHPNQAMRDGYDAMKRSQRAMQQAQEMAKRNRENARRVQEAANRNLQQNLRQQNQMNFNRLRVRQAVLNRVEPGLQGSPGSSGGKILLRIFVFVLMLVAFGTAWFVLAHK